MGSFPSRVVSLHFVKRKRSRETAKFDDTIEPLSFNWVTIRNATNNFSVANKIGEGGFGAVYKGQLSNGQEIAVRRVSCNSIQGSHEFKNEVKFVSKLHHRNLVRLLGFCLEDKKMNKRILIYEYVPNRSLDKHLFDKTKKLYLNWDKRYKIIGGIARGLCYLHEHSRITIIHCHLKAENILLDDEMNARISDFEMNRFFVDDRSQGNTTCIGKIGYIAPEYLLDGFITVKTDVFSFGVLVLEIISGQKITSFPQNLLNYAWKHWREGTALELMDPTLMQGFSRDEVMRSIHIGLLCVQEKAADRPTMSTVVTLLNDYSDIANVPSPSEPAFSGESIIRSNTVIRETELDQSTLYSEDVNEIRTNESLQFDLATIRKATNNFSSSYKIGEGLGAVYKGQLSGQEVAMKRISSNSELGLQQFKNELMLMHRLRLQHQNLVKVLGFCLEGDEKILVHEYVPNSSLDEYLFGNTKRSYLDWDRRYQIIKDIARGLVYLHTGSQFKIIHRNLKAQNILLDGEFNAKIADFGLANLFVHHQTQGKTSRIAGTIGYMAPEYVREGVISVKSDVFSFGILLLEIVSGQRCMGRSSFDPEHNLLSYAWNYWREGTELGQFIDWTLNDNFSGYEVMRIIHIGLLCLQQNVEDRPTMSSVVVMLDNHSLTLEAPSIPAFCTEYSISNMDTRDPDQSVPWSVAASCGSSPFNPRE